MPKIKGFGQSDDLDPEIVMDLYVLMQDITGIMLHVKALSDGSALEQADLFEMHSPFLFPEGARWEIVSVFTQEELEQM